MSSTTNIFPVKTIPIIYSPTYNFYFYGLENLHPFDGKKYEKIYKSLIEKKVIKLNQIVTPSMISNKTLLTLHDNDYINGLNYSSKVASYVEIFIVNIIPNYFVRKKLLEPMKYATNGSLIASEMALKENWAINLGGGFHHASAADGGGFCIYADISLIIIYINKKFTDINNFMIIDLDAHQGNGYETDKINNIFDNKNISVYIYDTFNPNIFPMDIKARKGIDFPVHVHSSTSDEEYLRDLNKNLDKIINEIKPQLIIYNAGTDCLKGDPLGGLRISEEGVIKRDEIIFSLSFQNKCPLVMLLSGGYQKNSANVIAKSITNLKKKFKIF